MVVAEVVEGDGGEPRDVQDLVPPLQQVQLQDRSSPQPVQPTTGVSSDNAVVSAAAAPIVAEVPQLSNEEALAAFPIAKLNKLEELISLIR